VVFFSLFLHLVWFAFGPDGFPLSWCHAIEAIVLSYFDRCPSDSVGPAWSYLAIDLHDLGRHESEAHPGSYYELGLTIEVPRPRDGVVQIALVWLTSTGTYIAYAFPFLHWFVVHGRLSWRTHHTKRGKGRLATMRLLFCTVRAPYGLYNWPS